MRVKKEMLYRVGAWFLGGATVLIMMRKAAILIQPLTFGVSWTFTKGAQYTHSVMCNWRLIIVVRHFFCSVFISDGEFSPASWIRYIGIVSEGLRLRLIDSLLVVRAQGVRGRGEISVDTSVVVVIDVGVYAVNPVLSYVTDLE